MTDNPHNEEHYHLFIYGFFGNSIYLKSNAASSLSYPPQDEYL